MLNYQIIIEYLGTNFVGWQIQKNGISIQSTIQKALSKALKKRIKINGSGRTDAGVHAKGQSANFLCSQKIKDKFKFLNTVNYFLKTKSISILKIKKKPINFHARHSVKKKIYKYIILNRSTISPLYENRSWLVKKKLDFQKMKNIERSASRRRTFYRWLLFIILGIFALYYLAPLYVMIITSLRVWKKSGRVTS